VERAAVLALGELLVGELRLRERALFAQRDDSLELVVKPPQPVEEELRERGRGRALRAERRAELGDRREREAGLVGAHGACRRRGSGTGVHGSAAPVYGVLVVDREEPARRQVAFAERRLRAEASSVALRGELAQEQLALGGRVRDAEDLL